jgi:hypothetical protein
MKGDGSPSTLLPGAFSPQRMEALALMVLLRDERNGPSDPQARRLTDWSKLRHPRAYFNLQAASDAGALAPV